MCMHWSLPCGLGGSGRLDPAAARGWPWLAEAAIPRPQCLQFFVKEADGMAKVLAFVRWTMRAAVDEARPGRSAPRSKAKAGVDDDADDDDDIEDKADWERMSGAARRKRRAEAMASGRVFAGRGGGKGGGHRARRRRAAAASSKAAEVAGGD